SDQWRGARVAGLYWVRAAGPSFMALRGVSRSYGGRAGFGGFGVVCTGGGPVPGVWLVFFWVGFGGLGGGIMWFGGGVWLASRGFREYRDWIGDPWVKNILVVTGIGWAMFAVLLGDTLYVGLASYARDGDSEREWRARSSGWIFAVTLVWIVLSGIVLFGP